MPVEASNSSAYRRPLANLLQTKIYDRSRDRLTIKEIERFPSNNPARQVEGSSAVANSTNERTMRNMELRASAGLTLSHFCHQRPIFVTDPGLLVPQLSLLIPFLSLRRAALYKEEEKGKEIVWGSLLVRKN